MISSILNVVLAFCVGLFLFGRILQFCMKPKDLSKLPNIRSQPELFSIPDTLCDAVRGDDFNPIDEDALLMTFSAEFCPPCKAACKKFIQYNKEFPNVRFMTCYNEDEGQAKIAQAMIKYEKEFGAPIDFTVAVIDSDIMNNYSSAFGIMGIPHSILFDKGQPIWHGNPHSPAFKYELAKLNNKYSAGSDNDSDEESDDNHITDEKSTLLSQ